LALALAYSLQFTAATLMMGRALSGSASGPGFQDAITPPWKTRIDLVLHAAILCTIGLGWWLKGPLQGVLVLLSVLIGAMLVRRLFPAPDAEYYRMVVIRSMSRRYADFVRSGESVRAGAMGMLLRNAGVDVNSLHQS
jgi:hypothetical protein